MNTGCRPAPVHSVAAQSPFLAYRLSGCHWLADALPCALRRLPRLKGTESHVSFPSLFGYAGTPWPGACGRPAGPVPPWRSSKVAEVVERDRDPHVRVGLARDCGSRPAGRVHGDRDGQSNPQGHARRARPVRDRWRRVRQPGDLEQGHSRSVTRRLARMHTITARLQAAQAQVRRQHLEWRQREDHPGRDHDRGVVFGQCVRRWQRRTAASRRSPQAHSTTTAVSSSANPSSVGRPVRRSAPSPSVPGGSAHRERPVPGRWRVQHPGDLEQRHGCDQRCGGTGGSRATARPFTNRPAATSPPSTSNGVKETSTPDATNTAVSASANPSNVGQPVTFLTCVAMQASPAAARPRGRPVPVDGARSGTR